MKTYRTRNMRAKKRLRVVDRLSNMPESLQLRILASLDARHAVQTSVLSKSWVSSWTCIPVLNFCSYGFTKLQDFDNFVVDVLSRRQPLNLDKLIFTRGGLCSNVKILEKVFDYASSHAVKELEANIEFNINKESWPYNNVASSDSLTSLKLESQTITDCSFLKPRFKNLTNLHLQRVGITDVDPFSGFPVLQKLKLVCCFLRTDGWVLNVHAPQLSEFTILYYTQDVNRCEFTTPKLRYFEWQGNNFPQLKANLPVLDTAFIDYNGYCHKEKQEIMFDDLLNLFNTLHKAKSLRLSSSIVHLLTLFPDELVNNSCCSAFRDLKCLKLDFTTFFRYRSVFQGERMLLMELLQLVPGVKAYLLHNSHNAKCTVMVMPDHKAQALMLPHFRDNKHSTELEV